MFGEEVEPERESAVRVGCVKLRRALESPDRGSRKRVGKITVFFLALERLTLGRNQQVSAGETDGCPVPASMVLELQDKHLRVPVVVSGGPGAIRRG